MPYFMYILECSDETLYVGYTNNIDKRLNAHNTAKTGAKYTKARRPVKLLYTESFPTLSEALRREAEIKSWKREKKLELMRQKS